MNLFDIDDPAEQGFVAARDPAPANGASARNSVPPEVAACLSAGGLVLTGNARAARALSLAYAQSQRRNGLEAWSSPRIADWASFLNSLWSQILLTGEDAPLLLSSLQEKAIWKRVAAQHGHADLVVSLDGMAELAQSAYALLNAYEAQGDLQRSWAYGGSSDAEAFRKWALSFDEICTKRNWISRSTLETRAVKAMLRADLDLPREVLLVGFDRVLPAQKRVLAALEEHGIKVGPLEGPLETGALPTIIAAKDKRDEIAACAWWARQRLLQRPDSRLGVILQNAAAARGEIERTFRRILLPASIGIDSAAVAEPYEFSLGRALTSVPLVRAAMLLLRWVDQPLPLEDVSWLLLSGFLSVTVDETSQLAQVDAALRQRTSMPPEVSLEWWLRHSRRPAQQEQPESARGGSRNRLLSVQRAAGTNGIRNSKRSYSYWLEAAREIMTIAGWPGPEKEDSSQFQARSKLEQVMDSVAALSFDGERVEYGDFLVALLHAVAETVFAPQSRNAPIQIIGPMEAAGQNFDAVWFLGADDQHWPPKAAPHPLIPLQLQRDLEMPHASSEADWNLSARVTRRIAGSAAECVFSYASHVPEGDLAVSPLLGKVFAAALPITSSSEFLPALGVTAAPRHLLQSIETTDTSLIPWPAEMLAGGTEVLKMQAACPFRAFATRRLGAGEFDEPQHGLSAADRGTVLHKVLERLWARDNEPQLLLQSRDDLRRAQAEQRIEQIIEHHVTEALRGHADPGNAWTTAYLDREQKRLCGLIKQWLEKEAERAAFAVTACEVKLPKVLVGELKLNLRIDRIDKVASGGFVLLDYKSGKVVNSEMDGARPDEPQLPLYSVYGNAADLKGAIYAQVRPNQLAFIGRIVDKKAFYAQGKASGLEAFNEELRAEWKKSLLALADEFIHGVNTVTPKKYPKTCEYCPLPSLCRVADTPVPVTADAVDEDDFGGEPTYE